jgi:hypothetical protein
MVNLGDASDVVVGPCLVVDRILQELKMGSIVELVEKFGVLGAQKSFRLTSSPAALDSPVYTSARVGLSLKAKKNSPEVLKRWGQPHRFLTNPELISKHKYLLVVQLHAAGKTKAQIKQIVNTTDKAIDNYVVAFKKGGNAAKFFGTKRSTADICEAFGAYAKANNNKNN